MTAPDRESWPPGPIPAALVVLFDVTDESTFQRVLRVVGDAFKDGPPTREVIGTIRETAAAVEKAAKEQP